MDFLWMIFNGWFWTATSASGKNNRDSGKAMAGANVENKFFE